MEETMVEQKNKMESISWHQNDKLIFIKMNLFEEGLKLDQLKIVFDEKSIEVSIRDREYSQKVELAQPVLPKLCIYKIVASCLDIKMKKDLHRTSKNNSWWKSLCKDGSLPGEPKKIEQNSDLSSLKDALPEESNKDSMKGSSDIQTEKSETLKIVMPKITHDWYQTETQVVIEIRVKKLKPDQVEIAFASTSLDC